MSSKDDQGIDDELVNTFPDNESRSSKITADSLLEEYDRFRKTPSPDMKKIVTQIKKDGYGWHGTPYNPNKKKEEEEKDRQYHLEYDKWVKDKAPNMKQVASDLSKDDSGWGHPPVDVSKFKKGGRRSRSHKKRKKTKKRTHKKRKAKRATKRRAKRSA